MRERPILFSGPMVRAILAEHKYQTRRLVTARRKDQRKWLSQETISRVARIEHRKDDWWAMAVGDPSLIVHGGHDMDGGHIGSVQCPYGQPGDRMWVRETWHLCGSCAWAGVAYRADDESKSNCPDGGRYHPWRPSIHMPRWASRITLEVTDVRVERLQEISEDDARAEGVEPAPFCRSGRPSGQEHVEAFEDLWTAINGKRAPWSSNPWVWCVSFRRLQP